YLHEARGGVAATVALAGAGVGGRDAARLVGDHGEDVDLGNAEAARGLLDRGAVLLGDARHDAALGRQRLVATAIVVVVAIVAAAAGAGAGTVGTVGRAERSELHA